MIAKKWEIKLVKLKLNFEYVVSCWWSTFDKDDTNELILQAKSVVEEFNHGLRLNSISKRDPKAVAARSYKIDNARLGILGLVSSEAKQTLSRVTGLPPYYYHVGACSSVAESSSSYYHPWFQEFFTYNCLQDIIDQQKGATDANQYLMESIGRLEVISLKAKEEGFDKSEIYAMITNTTRLQSEWSYGKAIGVDKKNDLVLGLIDALADTGCSISSNGVIDTSNRFKNY